MIHFVIAVSLGEPMSECVVRYANPEIRDKAMLKLRSQVWNDRKIMADIHVPKGWVK